MSTIYYPEILVTRYLDDVYLSSQDKGQASWEAFDGPELKNLLEKVKNISYHKDNIDRSATMFAHPTLQYFCRLVATIEHYKNLVEGKSDEVSPEKAMPTLPLPV